MSDSEEEEKMFLISFLCLINFANMFEAKHGYFWKYDVFGFRNFFRNNFIKGRIDNFLIRWFIFGTQAFFCVCHMFGC
jgi:hypothetical protein